MCNQSTVSRIDIPRPGLPYGYDSVDLSEMSESNTGTKALLQYSYILQVDSTTLVEDVRTYCSYLLLSQNTY